MDMEWTCAKISTSDPKELRILHIALNYMINVGSQEEHPDHSDLEQARKIREVISKARGN